MKVTHVILLSTFCLHVFAAVTIDFGADLQRIDGFGFCQTFGRAYIMNGSEGLPWDKQREVLGLLLSPETGAGFSILRLGVFGIQPNNPGGPDSPPQYYWDGDDGRQLWVAKEAQAYGVKRFYANPWSAPAYMKTNNDVNNGGQLCGLPGANCGGADWRQAYANYLVQYVRFYAQEGIQINDITFTNEPDYTASYDSMRFTPAQANDFIKVIGPTIAASGLNLNLVCCDSYGWNPHQVVYTQAIEADPQVAQWVGIHSGHSYASPSTTPLPTTKTTWMSEYALDAIDRWNPYWDDGAINSGIALANHIHDTLTGGGVNAYITWFGASVGNTAAPIQLDGPNYNVAKRLWATAAYSRFIRPGAHRVQVDSSSEPPAIKISAYRNAADDSRRVVNIINNGLQQLSLDVTLNGAQAGERLTVYRTDETHSLEVIDSTELSGPQATINAPSRSLITLVIERALPSTYEYFTEGGIQSGLTANTAGFFKLNGKDLRIISGAIHYFRVHPDQWRDRLRKLRAVGANTVETYVPWNLHEPEQGIFDFGDRGRDHSPFLNVSRFVEIAQEEDLLVIFRPGPYICAEFEAGGLPSWLQRDMNMGARSSYQPYLDRVKIYFENLLPQVANQQFTRGGSIVAIQLENEFGFMRPTDTVYMEWIKMCFDANGFDESLPFTSDNIRTVGAGGGLPGVLLTANLQSDPERDLDALLDLQPNRPILVAEYWSGWFDRWFQEEHSTTRPEDFAAVFEKILSDYDGSVNFYMFIGGTNFGFISGANNDDFNDWKYYGSHVTSYDYDAVLSEAGDYTEKYWLAQALIERYQVPALRRPDPPPQQVKIAYSPVALQSVLLWNDILARVPAEARFTGVPYPISMEELDMNNESGQSYGYIVYRRLFTGLGSPGSARLTVGPVKDFGTLLIDGEMQPLPTSTDTGYWINDAMEFDLSALDNTQSYLVDILVENMGHGLNVHRDQDAVQRKGIPAGNISVNGMPAEGFQVLALEFKSEWIRGLANWRPVDEVGTTIKAPAIFQSTFTIGGTPTDTFLDMRNWHKGVVFVNGFNLGRYFRAGPQQTLYVPAPALRLGTNTVTVFEQLEPGTEIRFISQPILNNTLPGQVRTVRA